MKKLFYATLLLLTASFALAQTTTTHLHGPNYSPGGNRYDQWEVDFHDAYDGSLYVTTITYTTGQSTSWAQGNADINGTTYNSQINGSVQQGIQQGWLTGGWETMPINGATFPSQSSNSDPPSSAWSIAMYEDWGYTNWFEKVCTGGNRITQGGGPDIRIGPCGLQKPPAVLW